MTTRLYPRRRPTAAVFLAVLQFVAGVVMTGLDAARSVVGE